MKRLVPMFDNSGARYSIPEDRVDEFRADMGEVAEARRYRGKDGQHYTIPQDQDEAFRADMPDAVPVRSYTMADGTRRDFTMSEMSKFLRSKEYRESEDYTPPQQGSVAGAAVKGALTGAAEGAYYGGKNALAKVATALPEAAASVGEAVGNTINLGGNAKNAVGDWLRASGQQTKRWLGENIRGDQYDENGNLVMSGLTKDLGYEDALTKIGETAGDAAAMAVKFAPAAVAGPAYMETIMASDGINAFADTFDRAKAAGYSDAQANLAGTAAGLINYYGAKLMMKGGAATKDIANPLLRALAGTGFTGAATAAQAVGNKGVENAIEGKPITEGMLGAAGEGFVEGAQFHLINEVGTNAKQSLAIRRETREMKEMRKENLLTASETPDGRVFISAIIDNEGVDAAIRARKEGKDVSRKMGAAADLPDNMSAAERNAVIDGISKAREAQAERVRTRMDDVQAQSLADEIGQNLMGGASDPMFEDIWLNATRRIKDATELDEPGARARIVGEAVEDVVGKQLDAGPANREAKSYEEKFAENRRLRTPTRVGEKEIAEDQEARAMGRRIEQEGELQRVNDKLNRFKKMVEIGNAQKREQAEYDEKMAAYEEARAQRVAEKKRGVSPSKLTPLPEKPVRPDSEASAPTTNPTETIKDADGASLVYRKQNDQYTVRLSNGEEQGISAASKAEAIAKFDAMTKTSRNPAKVDKGTPEKPVEASTKAEKGGEVVQPTKVPDGRGKMVEKPQTEQPSQPRDNAPSRAPTEAKPMSQADAKKPVEARNVASEAKVKGDKLGRTQSQIDEDNRIVADYDSIADAPNVINGDSIRKNMKGFKNDNTDTHHALTPRSTEIREKLFEKKLAERKGKGSGSPNEVLFTMGGGGSGKSTASKGLSEEVDFTYDSTGANIKDMRDKISRVIANGQKPKVLFVYCDPKTAWGRVASRTKKGGHAVSEDDFSGVHAQAIRNFDALRKEFGNDIIATVIDNRGDVGKMKFIKADEFSKLPRYTKKEILDVITGRGSEGSGVSGGAQEPSGKRGQVKPTATTRVPDGKGRMVKKAENPAQTAKAEGDPAYRVERRGKSYVIVSRNGNGQMLPTGGWTKLEASDNPTLFKTEKEANEVAAKFNRQEADLRSNLAGTTDMNAAEQISNLKAEEKAARARFNGERERVFGEIDDIIRQKADAVRKSWSKEIADEVDGILKKKTLSNDDMLKLGAYLIDAPSGGKPFKLKLGESGELTVNDNIDALLKTRNKVRSLGKEASKRYYEKSPSTPADRTSDPAIVEWAKKRGETVVTGADGKAKVSEETVRRFNADQIGKAVNATKNLIKGVKVEQVGREWSEELDNPDGADKSVKLKREGRVVGTYDPATKKVRLYSGADASTVYHELIGHAVHDWAKDNSKPLYNKLNRLASEAPKELVDEIRRNYPDADEATLAKEIIAHIAGKKGMENITPKLKDKPSTWYAKAYVAVRDAILDFMQKVGFRRIDVKKMESMSPMEAMDYLTEQAAKGRMLGKAEATGDGALTKFERWAVKMYDRYMPISTVSKDAADAKALQPGKEYDFQLRNFDAKKKEFGKILAEGDIAEESVADYMRAQSAPERNRRLREEFLKENKGGNPSDYDLWVQNNGGSGWSDERAAEHMKFFNSLPKERQDAIKKAADFLWKMQKEGMDRRVETGLISRDDADALMAAEQYHIPWKSAISEFDGEWRPWRGKNNFKSGEFAKAKGRATEAGDPIAWMFEEFSDAHLRAIENETRSILARDIEASGKFGKVIQNTPENQMKELRVKGGEGQANVVNFKRDGKTYSIVLEGERGDAIASGYTNRDLAHMPKKVQAFMRWWSSTATEWSPTFAVRNLIADNVDVARIVLAEQGVKQGVKTLAKYAVNRQRVFKEIMQYAWSGEMKKGGVLEQYSKEGGMIGGFQRQGYENLREQMSYENIRKQFEKDAKKGRNRTKSVLSLVPKAFVGIGHGIKTLNTYAELSSRVAMFKTNVDAGMSAKDAALYSRRITVDFNRKGNYTPVLNTLFMFSNSTIGATMRQIEAVHKGWKTPQGKRALALLFLQGLGTAAAEAWINGDDDENEKQGKGTWKDMPEHNYTSRLGIRVGDKFYGLPGHDDPLSRISWLGSSIGRMFFSKMKKADFAKEIGSFGTDMAGRFAGKGSTDIASGWNVLAPSALQWFFQALENKDFAGRPIQRPKFDDAQPWSQNGRASTPQSYKTVAEVLNAIGGGNEARSGKLFGIDKLSTDYSPEMIRHVFNSVFKNVGRDAGDLISMAEVGLRIADFDVRNAPIARNLVTKSNGNDNRFFEAQKAYKADVKELKDRESWKPGEKADYLKSHPWLREGSDGKTTVNRLINMANRDNPRSGIGSMGITQLRKLTEGKVRRKDGTYFEPNTPISDELKEKAREMLQKRQARVIEIMGK